MPNIFEIIKTVILGIVEGITEWLPISSTGHMILAKEWMQWNLREDFWELFLVVIQLGAILAVIVLYWDKLWPFHLKSTSVKPYFKNENGKLSKGKKFCNDYVYTDKILLWVKVLIASVPAAILGIAFDDKITKALSGKIGAYVVASALIIYGVLFIIIENIKKNETIKDVDEISYKKAFSIGLIQCLALIPGTSRSGSTILGASLLGTSRTTAADFSFFLSIPAMVGGSGIYLFGNRFTNEEFVILLVGCVVAFLVSILAIKFLVSYIKKHDFKAFGVYRIILGVFVIIYFALAN